MKKRFLSLLLCMLMIFTLPLSASAITDTEEAVGTYGLSKPTKVWNFSNEIYYFSGVAATSDLYSEYSFTNANKFEISVYNHHSEELTVKLLKRQSGVDWSVSTKEMEGHGYMIWTVSVDSSSEYILKFYAPSDFSGSIKKLS